MNVIIYDALKTTNNAFVGHISQFNHSQYRGSMAPREGRSPSLVGLSGGCGVIDTTANANKVCVGGGSKLDVILLSIG